jgi:hypothetical protein
VNEVNDQEINHFSNFQVKKMQIPTETTVTQNESSNKELLETENKSIPIEERNHNNQYKCDFCSKKEPELSNKKIMIEEEIYNSCKRKEIETEPRAYENQQFSFKRIFIL